MSMGYMLYIPSQIKENKLGYDALIQKLKYKKIKSLALQYKIVSQYKRKTLLERKTRRCQNEHRLALLYAV